MFGGGSGGRDPFGTPFEHMHRQMRQMDNMMNAMLGDAFDMLNNFGMTGPQQPMLTDDPSRYPPPQGRHRIGEDMMMSPFAGFGFGGGPMFGGMMNHMQNLHDRALDDPNSVVFSNSTVVSYDGTGQPKIVQHSTRKAGDVKETRKAFRDGDKEEMTVGHSIGDRTHIIEKKRHRDGKFHQQQKFVNLGEDEAEEFNRQFKTRAQEHLGGFFNGNEQRQYAIESGKHPNGRKGRNVANSASSASASRCTNARESPATPIITIPDEDDEDAMNRRTRGRRGGAGRYDEDVVYSNSGIGPTIQEIDDDGADSANPKRRKGVSGKFIG